MSIQSEITRISNNVQNTIDVIEQTGVSVPAGANSDNLPSLAQALANEKQNKLTGTQGQVVGFDSSGNAIATEPPSVSAVQTVTLLSTGWTQSGDRYSQTVNCSIVAADTPVVVVDVALSGTDLDADNEALSAWAGPSANNVTQGAGTLTFYSAEAPTVNIPVNVGVG